MSRVGVVLVRAAIGIGGTASLCALGVGTGFLAVPEAPEGSDPAGSEARLPAAGKDAGPAPAAGPTLGGSRIGLVQDEGDPPYDGRFTFIRVRFGNAGTDLRNFGYGRRGRGRGREPPWQHDYPRAERNFARILDATTFVDTYMEGNSGRILTLDDPDLFKYPFAYVVEVGAWQPSQEEVRGLREYLLKGGFLVVDDFRGYDINNFAYQMRRVLPGFEIQLMPLDHEIFDSFFYIENPEDLVAPYGRDVPQYLGIFEDNDPIEGRIMVMINYNQDIQEYWEFSDQGYYPIELSNEAYQFGVNYVIYAFTH